MTNCPHDTPPWRRLTARVRFVSVTLGLLLLTGWIGWFYPFDDLLDGSGTPLGADFTMFYVAGSIARDGQFDQLYDQAAHQQRLHALFPRINPSFCLPFRYPPFVAAIAGAVADLPYPGAFALFAGLSAAAGWTALRFLRGSWSWFQRPPGRGLLWAAVGWPVALETWIGGQASLFSLLIAVSTIFCLRQGKNHMAGCCLALAIFKPNVLLLLGVGLVIYRPAILKGAIPAVLGILMTTLAWGGPTVFSDYVAATTQLATGAWDVETPSWKVHSIASWIAAVPHHRLLTTLVGLLWATLVALRWRRNSASSAVAIALLITLNATFNPYTPIYDLSLLVVGLAAAAQYYYVERQVEGISATDGAASRWLYGVLLAVFFGPHLSQSLAVATGQQFFPLLLLLAAVKLTVELWAATESTADVEIHRNTSLNAV